MVMAPVVQASGVFINMHGDVLTARHAVSECKQIFVVKHGKVATAEIAAVSNEDDVAVLRTTLKPLLAATISELPVPAEHSIAVFSEAYAELQHLPDRARLLGNALTVPGQPGSLQMVSGAKPGTSGSAVLDGGGLLLGIVVERVAAGSGGVGGELSVSHAQSRAGMATLVRAVPGSEIARFLSQAGIPFAQSRQAQLSSLQSPASRASTLAVGIVCG
ncbi:trypsin-like peptidase domain-containing protein [Herbaspirillum robiniae]|uniref:trypsin-like peptidase domain-containing protein n=1 Tax=Herbaspirillum robiniae TaxID=2014887 RepID=UPI003D7736BE